MSLKFNRSQDRFIVYRQNGRCGNCGGELKYVAQQYQNSVDGVVEYVESEHIEYVHGRSQTVSGVLSRNLGV